MALQAGQFAYHLKKQAIQAKLEYLGIDYEWSEHFDEYSQRYYYFNCLTYETTWTMPAGFEEKMAELKEKKEAATKLQAIFRGRTGWAEGQERKKREQAALRVQTRWRCRKGQFAAHLRRRALEEQRAAEVKAATMLQSIFRAKLAQRDVEGRLALERAALRVQRVWRESRDATLRWSSAEPKQRH